MARILIIEDNPDFVAFVQAILDLKGHSVTRSASLRNGILLARQEPQPDLVLLDLDLPDGNGLDFFAQVATDADLARQLQARNVRYFTKPISARDLIQVVNTSLTKGETHDAAAYPHRR